MQWVVDRRKQHKSQQERAKNAELGSDDEPDWVRNFVVNKSNEQDKKIKQKKSRLGLENVGQREYESRRKKEGKKNLEIRNSNLDLSEEEYLLEEYESEEEGDLTDGNSKRKAGGVSLISSSDDEEEDGSDEEEEEKLQVYFCSRTHSQLSQFVRELRKTFFANDMTVVCLGSRKNFCINEGTALSSHQ